MFKPSLAEEKAILTAMLAAGVWGPGDMEVHLFKNDVTPTVETVVGDLDEADFDGYAAITTLDMNTPTLANDGSYETVAKTTSIFTCTGDTTPNTVYGYYMKDKAGVYMGAERFDEPQTMAKEDDSISFTISLEAALAGAAVVSP